MTGQETYEGQLAQRAAELLPVADNAGRLELLGVMDPDDMRASLAWLVSFAPQTFDFALVRDRKLVERLQDRLDHQHDDDPEPYCTTCGASAGIFIGHGDAWLHYTGAGTAASPVELYDAGHEPVIGWREAAPPNANPPHRATDDEYQCSSLDRDSGSICIAQAGHDGPDHIAHGWQGDGEYHRWPVAADGRDDEAAAVTCTRTIWVDGRPEQCGEPVDHEPAATCPGNPHARPAVPSAGTALLAELRDRMGVGEPVDRPGDQWGAPEVCVCGHLVAAHTGDGLGIGNDRCDECDCVDLVVAAEIAGDR